MEQKDNTQPGLRNSFVLLAVGSLSLAIYIPTMSRHVVPGDVSIFLVRASRLILDGFAQTHSLFLLIVHPFLAIPGIPPPTAGSLVSATAAAGAVVFAYATIHNLTSDRWAAGVGALSLAVAHTMWFHAVIPEVYTLNALFQGAALFFACRWYTRHRATDLWLMAFLASLGCMNHLLSAITLVTCMVWAGVVTHTEKRPGRHLAGAVGACSLGLAPLAALVARDAARLGISQALRAAVIGGSGMFGGGTTTFTNIVTKWSVVRILKQTAGSLIAACYNFASPVFLLIAAEVCHFFRHREHPQTLISSLFAVHLAFGCLYRVNDYWAFLLPAWLPLSVMGGLGFARFVSSRLKHRRPAPRAMLATAFTASVLVCPAVVYRSAPILADAMAHNMLTDRGTGVNTSHMNYWRFYLWPPKYNAGAAEDWVRKTLRSVPRGSLLMLSTANHKIALYLQEMQDWPGQVELTVLGPESVESALRKGQRVFVESAAAFEQLELPEKKYRVKRYRSAYEVLRTAPGNNRGSHATR